jgi:hypothetical protein
MSLSCLAEMVRAVGAFCKAIFVSEAIRQTLERIAHDFIVAGVRQRPRRVARRDVLASIDLIADRRAQQSQRRSSALQLFARAMNVGFTSAELLDRAAELMHEDVAALLHGTSGGSERLQRPIGHDPRRVTRADA